MTLDPFDARVITAGNEAYGAWLRAVAWALSYGHGDTGHLPDPVALVLATREVWDRIVAAGLARAHDRGYELLAVTPPSRRVASPGEQGGELRAWREARGWSQARAAKELGVPLGTLKSAETRRSMPPSKCTLSASQLRDRKIQEKNFIPHPRTGILPMASLRTTEKLPCFPAV